MPVGRSVSRRAAMGAVVVLLAIAPLAGADAAPASRRATAQDSVRPELGSAAQRALAAAKNKYGIPVLPYSDVSIPSAYDGTGIASADASKLKTTIALPEVTFLSYLKLCTQVIQLDPDFPEQCGNFHPPTTDFDSFDNPSFPVWIQATGPIWIKSPAGAPLAYGSFASTRVRTLAFGSVPVTATVNISQPVAGGQVSPLNVRYLTTASPVPSKGTFYKNQYWPGFSYDGNGNNSLYDNHFFEVTGRVDVRVSDVELDGELVDVGPACRTSTPGTLRIGSPTGVYDKTITANDLRGRPGGAQVLSPDDAGSAQGRVSIPSFTGCGSGRQDLDALITSFVSGSNNPLDVTFTRALSECSNPSRTQPCPDYPAEAAPVTPPAALKAAAASAKVSPMWQKLTAVQRNRVARKLAGLPRAERSQLLPTLATPIAAAVRKAAK